MAPVDAHVLLIQYLSSRVHSPRRMFNQHDLQVLLGGVNTLVDIDDLQRNTNYGGLYSAEEFLFFLRF